MSKEYFIIQKKDKEFLLKDCKILKMNEVSLGSRAKVISGKKIPLNTEGTIVRVFPNKFSHNANDNPSIQLKLDDGTEVWTTGKNLINISDTGVGGIKVFSNSFEAVKYFENFKLRENL